MKSLIITYICSLIGGVFGLHHLYLGRVQHAFLWFTTFGGFFIGFIYEMLFLIKNYVREINNDHSLLIEYKIKMFERKSPAFEILRFCGQYSTAIFYGFITYYAFPETWHKNSNLSLSIGFCCTIAIAFGVYITGTVGPRQCSFLWPLIGAIFGLPFIVWYYDSSPSFNISALISSWIFEWKVEWNQTYFPDLSTINLNQLSPKQIKRKRRQSIKRYLLFGVGILVFSAIFTSTIYQNLQVDINGRRVKIKDVLTDFYKSQEFVLLCQQLYSVMQQLWTFYSQYGLKGIWTEIWMTLESQNEQQAFETLNLYDDASQKEIESQCRILSRKWHPDRYRNSEEKRKAEIMFMNIQQACDRLSDGRKRRQLINTKRRENPD